jgi:hypothetical protein
MSFVISDGHKTFPTEFRIDALESGKVLLRAFEDNDFVNAMLDPITALRIAEALIVRANGILLTEARR